MDEDLNTTELTGLHQSLGAKMVPFAGYTMPVHYAAGVLKEHQHTRDAAGLFDVSHMGQIILRGPDVARGLESLIPMNVLDLPEGRQRYGFFTNDQGGIEDDLMFANRGDHLFLVVNAACKSADLERLKLALVPRGISVEPMADRALLALQGPKAAQVLAKLMPDVTGMRFMDVADVTWSGDTLWISRSGYTGEDGFEISVPQHLAGELAERLLAEDTVLPIGLGARDSLRLEAGLCLYGNDIDTKTSPVSAGLTWAIQKARRAGGARAGGFPGAARILSDLANGPEEIRVGLRPRGRAPMRGGVMLYPDAQAETPIGRITSGGFGPSIGGPVAMGYVQTGFASRRTQLFGELRGKRQPIDVVDLPFVAPGFKR